jgi:two-component system, chemotaxis family, sensor histidine kinase and response regulator PixL
MAIDADIRDQAYQFFIQEAPDLLQVIETELLTLREDRSTPKIHSMMRAAHSLKGGAASVGLEAIKKIAHRLEDCFKALHHDELEIDTTLETLFLKGFDCLRNPLIDEIEMGYHDVSSSSEASEAIFAELETRLEQFLGAEAHLPSSIELGVDIAQSIFEVDIAEGLERLVQVLSSPADASMIAGEFRAQAEVFIGIAELLTLPGFAAIAQTTLDALDTNPKHAHTIAQLALADFQAGHQAVLAGDRLQGGQPSAALAHWTGTAVPESDRELPSIAEISSLSITPDVASSSDLDNIWGNALPIDPQPEIPFAPDLAELWGAEADELADEAIAESEPSPELAASDLEALWGSEPPADLVSANLSDATEEPSVAPSKTLIDLESLWGDEHAEPVAAEPISTECPALDMEMLWGDEVSTAASHEHLVTSDDLDAFVVNEGIPAQPISDILAASAQPIQDWVQAIATDFEALPTADDSMVGQSAVAPIANSQPTQVSSPAQTNLEADPSPLAQTAKANRDSDANQLVVKVGFDRLERMNNQVGELVINRNSLSLQNEQLQKTVQELLRRFNQFQAMASQLRDFSDRMLITPDRRAALDSQRLVSPTVPPALTPPSKFQTDFDSLEMDSYGELHLLLQSTLEEIAHLEETTGDIALLSKQSNQALVVQRQMLGRLQDDLMWARMLPIGQVLNRFPRVLRDLSVQHHKPVNLKLSGTGVLIDKAVLEQLYSPLMHLLRNAFDHGIEPPDVRREQGKPEQGQIEIRAYHRGSQTILDVQDDGRGLDYERIREKVVEHNWVQAEQATTLSNAQLIDYLFQPGFSTAARVTDLSGRGVGLDVVQSQLQTLKGSIAVTSEPGQGTTFTLRIPLTLTITKLLVCLAGGSAIALPSDSIEEILVPKPEHIKRSGQRQFLYWREQIVPIASLANVLDYAYPLPESSLSQVLATAPTPDDWALPLLMLRQGQQILALEVERIATEQELVIKPFGSVLAPPSYLYGCTILGDGSIVPVLDSASVFEQITQGSHRQSEGTSVELEALPEMGSGAVRPKPLPTLATGTATILIVDDSMALRQTLALTLQKANYRVLQARDGREALEQLQKNSQIQMVICDVEMPNMNGFEFLSHRRQDATINQIPVAMLTSRSNDKHRRLATHLGATAYFTKPYIEQEFLSAIAQIMQTRQPISAS